MVIDSEQRGKSNANNRTESHYETPMSAQEENELDRQFEYEESFEDELAEEHSYTINEAMGKGNGRGIYQKKGKHINRKYLMNQLGHKSTIR